MQTYVHTHIPTHACTQVCIHECVHARMQTSFDTPHCLSGSAPQSRCVYTVLCMPQPCHGKSNFPEIGSSAGCTRPSKCAGAKPSKTASLLLWFALIPGGVKRTCDTCSRFSNQLPCCIVWMWGGNSVSANRRACAAKTVPNMTLADPSFSQNRPRWRQPLKSDDNV